MGKQERRFNHWVDAHEKELTILMKDPEKWSICKQIAGSGSEDDLEERIFEAADKFMPAE